MDLYLDGCLDSRLILGLGLGFELLFTFGLGWDHGFWIEAQNESEDLDFDSGFRLG